MVSASCLSYVPPYTVHDALRCLILYVQLIPINSRYICCNAAAVLCCIPERRTHVHLVHLTGKPASGSIRLHG